MSSIFPIEQLTGTLSPIATLEGTLTATGELTGELSIFQGNYTTYTGAYEFTPTQTTQTVAIMDRVASQNITINPIPNNYGLITWDGATLTVS